MLAWYRALIRMRRSTPCLNDGTPGKTRVTYDEQARWLQMDRGSIAVICNLGERRTFKRPPAAKALLESQAVTPAGEDTIEVPPNTVVILEQSQK
jgi:maltooligosyltrehalose trehalohydrolase